MPYDEVLAARIADLLLGEPGVTSRTMFGGMGFMVEGHMAVAPGSGGSLMVRVDPTTSEGWLDGDSVQHMEMRGGLLAGWLLVSADGLASDDALQVWVDRGVAYVRSLPPK